MQVFREHLSLPSPVVYSAVSATHAARIYTFACSLGPPFDGVFGLPLSAVAYILMLLLRPVRLERASDYDIRRHKMTLSRRQSILNSCGFNVEGFSLIICFQRLAGWNHAALNTADQTSIDSKVLLLLHTSTSNK